MKAENVIKVGFCIAYDWALLKKSIPRIYKEADLICLSIDRNRRSWSGETYAFNSPEFKTWISSIDVEKKIDIYEDVFFLPELSAMENDSRQRNMMAERMGPGGWHVQIDSDEYFLDFSKFVSTLLKIDSRPDGKAKALNVCVCLIPLIKKLASGFLYVDFKNQIPETVPIATNVPVYLNARRNNHFSMITPHYVVHETWARSDEELWFKINSWGHSDVEMAGNHVKLSYFNLWKSLDENNYQYLRNFHPASPKAWPALNFAKGETAEAVIHNLESISFPFTSVQLWLTNNRNVARVKGLLSKLTR